ncbi:MAG: OmpA family protein [Magnetococcales bacterium]|nr:OmpA family protein [Magnetococcales bacterium]
MMNLKRVLSLLGVGALALTLTSCAPPTIEEGWMHQGFRQWHPQEGQAQVASTGTQCYFCTPTAQPAPQKVDGDSDGDMVADSRDQCPGTPRGITVDSRGCPLNVDSDNDGIQDHADKCPQTPVGAKVDVHGCWQPGPVQFKSGSTKIGPNAQTMLKELLIVLKNNPNVTLGIHGHADNRGNDKANKKLAEGRAKAVEQYLIKGGIAKNRLMISTFGEEQPVADNKSKQGRAQNRRVEFVPQPH